MLGMNGSGLSGIAYFTPIDTFSNTLVTVLLVGSSGPETVSATDATGAGDDVTGAVEDAAGAVKDVSTGADPATSSG
jgi:hypothetical protein